MGEIFGKLILFIFGTVAARFCMTIVDSNEAQTARLQAQKQMYHLAAFIQHDRRQRASVPLSDMTQNYMSQMLGVFSDAQKFEGLGCYEIPEAERKGRLKGMEFYLYDKKIETGVLANGTVFDGKLGPDLLARLQSGNLE